MTSSRGFRGVGSVPRRLFAALLEITSAAVLLILGVGCVGGEVRAVVDEAFAGEQPGSHEAVSGAPPSDPAALSITPTGLPATHVTVVAPEAILPKMDEAFTERTLPHGAEAHGTASSPADRRDGSPERGRAR